VERALLRTLDGTGNRDPTRALDPIYQAHQPWLVSCGAAARTDLFGLKFRPLEKTWAGLQPRPREELLAQSDAEALQRHSATLG
jgi:hypothetical protein